MSKGWADNVKAKIDSFMSRRKEIGNALDSLLNELAVSPYNMSATSSAVQGKDGIWKVSIEFQKFTISEEEIIKEQIVIGVDENMNKFDTGEVLDIKTALQNIIIRKLK